MSLNEKKSTFRSRSLSSIGAKLTKLQLFFNFTTNNGIFLYGQGSGPRIWAKPPLDKDLGPGYRFLRQVSFAKETSPRQNP